MSGVAAINAGEATIGLVPRYLRGKEATVNQPWAPEWDQPTQQMAEPAIPEAPPAPPVMRTASPTEELRRRIAEVAVPERRGLRPVWFGLVAVVVLVVAGALFPDTVFALLPDVDTPH